jgi:hypothetical protein
MFSGQVVYVQAIDLIIVPEFNVSGCVDKYDIQPKTQR